MKNENMYEKLVTQIIKQLIDNYKETLLSYREGVDENDEKKMSEIAYKSIFFEVQILGLLFVRITAINSPGIVKKLSEQIADNVAKCFDENENFDITKFDFGMIAGHTEAEQGKRPRGDFTIN